MGFAVTRSSRSLVPPSSPTVPAAETLLPLSALDRVPGLRHLVLSLHAFDGADGKGSPASVLREALGKALVDYYPFAGRFVAEEDTAGEVRVACTGEGAWFVEPPLDMPIMVQVTEFTCGGFVVGLISVHTIADGLGAGQFINAVADYARGLPKPRVSPVWARDLVPDPPRMPAPPPKLELLDLHGLTVDFSPDHIAKTKADFFACTGQRCSAFDVCVAKTWQSRTRALRLAGGAFADSDSPVHVCFFANTRHLMLPSAGAGFYGNCFYPVTVTCGSGEVAAGEVVDVVRAVRNAKAKLAGDVARWAVGGFAQDPYELRFTYDSLFVSDWTRLGFLEADYGWGPPAHVVPFSYHPFMAVAVIGAPPAPKVGARVMTMCVEEAHLPEFSDQMNAFASSADK
uniref:Uncharacterized protein n=1 Tax=Avena sativa TaxID=4498 RepID=A0ACD5ZMQ2_AVESA